MTGLLHIAQAVVVEGRDDEAAVYAAVDAFTIATHGFGIRQETLQLIEKAYNEQGIIIFTDPDHAGQKIRQRLTKLFPLAGQAYLARTRAEKDGDIGIENAAPADIAAALQKAANTQAAGAKPQSGGQAQADGAKPRKKDTEGAGQSEAFAKAGNSGQSGAFAGEKQIFTPYTKQEMFSLGLSGSDDAMQRREALGAALGIGGGNSTAFLKKLNSFQISRKELETACRSFQEQTK